MGWNHGGAILATAQTDVGFSCRRSSARGSSAIGRMESVGAC